MKEICLLFLDERGSVTKWTDDNGSLRIRGGKDEGDVTANSGTVATLLTPVGICNKSLIFTDIPFATFIYKTTKMSVELHQVIEVKDRSAGVGGPALATANTELKFSVDIAGSFTPTPDFIAIQNP